MRIIAPGRFAFQCQRLANRTELSRRGDRQTGQNGTLDVRSSMWRPLAAWRQVFRVLRRPVSGTMLPIWQLRVRAGRRGGVAVPSPDRVCLFRPRMSEDTRRGAGSRCWLSRHGPRPEAAGSWSASALLALRAYSLGHHSVGFPAGMGAIHARQPRMVQASLRSSGSRQIRSTTLAMNARPASSGSKR